MANARSFCWPNESVPETGAAFLGRVDEVMVGQERADAHRDQDAAGPDRRLRNPQEHRRRRTFDHDFGSAGEILGCDNRDRGVERLDAPSGASPVARRHGGQNQPGNPLVEAPGHRHTDGSEATETDSKGFRYDCGHPTPRRFEIRLETGYY